MVAILTHWWAMKGFLMALPASLVEMYQRELGMVRNDLVVVRMIELGWAPEAMALDMASDSGEGYGSDRYNQVLEVIREVQARFNMKDKRAMTTRKDEVREA